MGSQYRENYKRMVGKNTNAYDSNQDLAVKANVDSEVTSLNNDIVTVSGLVISGGGGGTSPTSDVIKTTSFTFESGNHNRVISNYGAASTISGVLPSGTLAEGTVFTVANMNDTSKNFRIATAGETIYCPANGRVLNSYGDYFELPDATGSNTSIRKMSNDSWIILNNVSVIIPPPPTPPISWLTFNNLTGFTPGAFPAPEDGDGEALTYMDIRLYTPAEEITEAFASGYFNGATWTTGLAATEAPVSCSECVAFINISNVSVGETNLYSPSLLIAYSDCEASPGSVTANEINGGSLGLGAGIEISFYIRDNGTLYWRKDAEGTVFTPAEAQEFT